MCFAVASFRATGNPPAVDTAILTGQDNGELGYLEPGRLGDWATGLRPGRAAERQTDHQERK